jgi:hypothetical protein
MPLAPEGLTAIRQWVGTTPDDTIIGNIFTGQADNHDRTVMFILRQRLAALTTEPSSLTVPGLSISHSTDYQALIELMKQFRTQGGTGLDEEAMFMVGSSSMRRDFPR